MSEHLLDRHAKRLEVDPAQSAWFRGSTESLDDAVLVRLEGELDMATASGLDRVLNMALDIGASSVALDLTELTFLDSTGIHVLLSAHHRAVEQGCSFVVRSPTRSVLKVIRLTGLDQLMVIDQGPLT